MSYTALYRKFRPDIFEDVKGQEHIVATLKNQIKSGRIGHAYLFTGTRGTGKTTVAKLFAKSVNCENPVDGSPCGECRSCRTISAGAGMNVIEIDAASNNGVDNIREIVDEVAYSPVEGKYKVYIIDEVHMLSIGAFNALLKTLEEPPSYVIFILATTEVQKLPATILSRCQRYDFRRIPIDTITDRLLELMNEEGIDAEEKALRYIAKAADGSMRDALSLLDQCISFHFGETLTYDKALDVLGAVDTNVFGRLIEEITEGNVSGCIRLIEEIVMQGRELSQFIADVVWYLRNLLLVKTSDGDLENVIDASSENLMRLKSEADALETEEIMRYIRIFSELSGQLRYAVQKRVLIEMTLIKLCRPQMESSGDAVEARIKNIEKTLESGVLRAPLPEEKEIPEQEAPVKKELSKAIPEDIQKIVKGWSSIVAGTRPPLKVYLKNARLDLGNDNQLVVVVEDGIAFDYLSNEENRRMLEDVVSAHIQKEVSVRIDRIRSDAPYDASHIDLFKVINMEVETE